MLVFINTAKTFSEEAAPAVSLTEPVFNQEAMMLVSQLQKLNVPALEKLMHISTKIAEQNHNRFANWTSCQKMPALHGFNGDIYKKLKASPLTTANWTFAQRYLRILSGLYGVLKPMDAINPYRLEMYTKMKVAEKKSLHDFWREKLTKQVNIDLKQSGCKVILNLASKEYFSVLDETRLGAPVLEVVFKERTDKGLKIVAIYSKQARGLMARYIIDEQITDPERLKSFDLEGYKFDVSLSSESSFVFVR